MACGRLNRPPRKGGEGRRDDGVEKKRRVSAAFCLCAAGMLFLFRCAIARFPFGNDRGAVFLIYPFAQEHLDKRLVWHITLVCKLAQFVQHELGQAQVASTPHGVEATVPRGCFANGGLSHGDASRRPPRLVAAEQIMAFAI